MTRLSNPFRTRSRLVPAASHVVAKEVLYIKGTQQLPHTALIRAASIRVDSLDTPRHSYDMSHLLRVHPHSSVQTCGCFEGKSRSKEREEEVIRIQEAACVMGLGLGLRCRIRGAYLQAAHFETASDQKSFFQFSKSLSLACLCIEAFQFRLHVLMG